MSPTAQLAAEAKAGQKPGDKGGAKKKGSKKKLVIIALVVLLVGGYEAKSMLMKPHYAPGQKVPLGKILPLDQLTVNLSDGHIVQASISLQLTVVASPGSLGSDLPRFEDAAISVLGAETYDGLLAPGGRDKAKASLLKDFQKIAGTADGAAQKVSAVYFTGFVLQ